jgi:hypothetical protein
MTSAEKAHNYLARHPGELFCDQCLARHVGETVKVLSKTVENLGVVFQRSVRRRSGKCSVCGNEGHATAFAV